MSASISKNRVFLSYGRVDDVPFVRRLHADLIRTGFESVWFDEDSLMSRGKTFHQEIKDAIRTQVDRIVYVGGPAAAASAYVREELKLGLEYDHIVVTPILRLGDYEDIPGELSLFHCEDFRDDSNYASSLAKLINNLRQPNPKLGPLFAVPTLPSNFLARPELMRRLRDALLVDLQTPQVITGVNARVGIHGMGGIGKSILAAALARNREVRKSYPDGVVWLPFGQNLTQDELLSRMRDLAAHLKGNTAFESLPQGQGMLRELLQPKSVLLTLDDVWRDSDARWFADLGPRCRMLVTTRDAGILHLPNGELVPVPLFTEAEAFQFLAEAVGLEVSALPCEAREVAVECGLLPLALALSAGMANKRGGDFSAVLKRLRRADLNKITDREPVNETHRSIWCAMQASVETLDEKEQRRFAELAVFPEGENVPEIAVATVWASTGNLSDLDTEDFLIDLSERSLIQLDRKEGDDGQIERRVSLHDLLHDYATCIAGDPRALHQILVDAYRKLCAGGWPSGPDDGYFFQHLCRHFALGGYKNDLSNLLLDLRWLEAKNEYGLTFDLLRDYNLALQTLSVDHPQRRTLELLDEALRREIHFIARHAKDFPQALFQCMWNLCWWYDCEDKTTLYEPAISEQCQRSYGGGDQSMRLCTLMEAWRALKEQATPGFQWLRSLRPMHNYLGSGLKAIVRGHSDKVNSVAFSPDGRKIVSASNDQTIRVWDIDVGLTLQHLITRSECFERCVFLADGKHILCMKSWLYHDSGLRWLGLNDGREVRSISNDDINARIIAFSTDASLMAAQLDDGCIRVSTIEESGEPVYLRISGRKLSFSPDGRNLALVDGNNNVFVCDVQTGDHFFLHSAHRGQINCIEWSPDGNCIATGSGDGRKAETSVRLWSIRSCSERHCFTTPRIAVKSVAFAPDGKRLACGASSNVIHIWDSRSGEELGRFHTPDMIHCLAFSPDGRFIVAGLGWHGSGTVAIWEIESATPRNLVEHKYGIYCLSFSSDGRRLVSGALDNTVRVWDAICGRQLLCLTGHTATVWSVAFSSDGRLIASGSTDASARVWDSETGEALCRCELDSTVDYVSFTSDCTRLITQTSAGKTRQWDVRNGQEIPLVELPDGINARQGVSPDDRWIVRYCRGGLRVVDKETGKELTTLSNGDHNPLELRFSADGLRVIGRVFHNNVYGPGVSIRIWDAQTGCCLEDTPADANLEDIALSPSKFPYRLFSYKQESVVEDVDTKRPVAWFPLPLKNATISPSGRGWAGAVSPHLYILALEGEHRPQQQSEF